MRHHGIMGAHKTAKVPTTIPAEDAPPLSDLIGRRFAAGRPDVIVERASAGATTFTNTLLGVSAGDDGLHP